MKPLEMYITFLSGTGLPPFVRGEDKMSELVFSDMVSCVTAVIAHPVDAVWSKLLDQAAWMTEFRIESVEGDRNREGELKKVVPPQPEARHFFFKTLLLVPYRRFVYKAYTDDRTGQYGFTGIEVLSVSDLGKDSTVTFEAYLEVQSETMTHEQLSTFVRQAKEGSVAMWHRNFGRLESIIATGNA
jgi:hypothetical protein